MATELILDNKNKELKDLSIDNNALILTFIDDTCIKLFDAGQNCCEVRWMHSDDDLAYFIGATLQDADVQDGPTVQGSDVQESQFLIISTSKGQFTVVNYNEHNGYYDGFIIVAENVKPV